MLLGFEIFAQLLRVSAHGQFVYFGFRSFAGLQCNLLAIFPLFSNMLKQKRSLKGKTACLLSSVCHRDDPDHGQSPAFVTVGKWWTISHMVSLWTLSHAWSTFFRVSMRFKVVSITISNGESFSSRPHRGHASGHTGRC